MLPLNDVEEHVRRQTVTNGHVLVLQIENNLRNKFYIWKSAYKSDVGSLRAGWSPRVSFIFLFTKYLQPTCCVPDLCFSALTVT